jgi:hypothetical protein
MVDNTQVINIAEASTSARRATMGFGVTSAGTSGWIMGQGYSNNTVKDFYLYDVTAGAQRFYIDTSGRVIINGGTNANARQLTVNHSSHNYLSFELSGTEQFLFGFENTSPKRALIYDSIIGAYRQIWDTNGNIGFNGPPSAGGGTNVLFITNRGTAPTSNPSGGGILYADSGAGKWRGSSGTVTTFAAAGPHCEACGYDAWAIAIRNDQWRAYIYKCGNCGAIYQDGPKRVLDQLSAEEKRAIIRKGMTYDELVAMLG